jgi:predicted nucleotide-binding protein
MRTRERQATVPAVADQELAVHLFVPLGGPEAAGAYRHLSRVWEACRGTLGMTERVRGFPGLAVLPEAAGDLPGEGVAAVQENAAADRQSVLRRVHDILILSVLLAQPAPEGRGPRPGGRRALIRPAAQPARQRLGWADFAQAWERARGPGNGAALGEVRLFLAEMKGGARGAAAASPEFGQSMDPLLPYREDRAQGWWQRGATTAAGYAAWDTVPGGTGATREIVLVAAAGQGRQMSAWAWSDETASFPPFAQYLLQAAKLRYEARLLGAWHRQAPAADTAAGAAAVLAELDVALAPGDGRPRAGELLRSLLSRLRAAEARLTALEADLAQLAETVSIAAANLGAVPGCQAGPGATGMFAADQLLAGWLAEQIGSDLRYLRVDLRRASRVRGLAEDELAQAHRDRPAASAAGVRAAGEAEGGEAPARTGPDVSRRVFIVHGRDGVLVSRFRDLLHAVNLEPLDWRTLVEATGSTAPYLGQVVAQAPRLAQATLVLLSPDDVVELHSELYQPNDHPHERARSAQARPNVFFECGLALAAYPDKVIVVETGQMRQAGDLAGLNVIRFNGSAQAIKRVLDRLEQAGCPVDVSGGDWLDPGRFASLAACTRGPGTHRPEEK